MDKSVSTEFILLTVGNKGKFSSRPLPALTILQDGYKKSMGIFGVR